MFKNHKYHNIIIVGISHRRGKLCGRRGEGMAFFDLSMGGFLEGGGGPVI